jgi:hypothetical protein
MILCVTFLFFPNVDSAQAQTMGQRLQGRLLLQVEDGGRIWYVNPINLKRREVIFHKAVEGFAQLSLGISNKDFEKIPSDKRMTERLKGRFLLQVENDGRLWYVSPQDGKKINISSQNYRSVIKSLALGISNDDLFQIPEQRSTSDTCAVLRNQKELTQIKLPEEIKKVGRLTYFETNEKLLLVVEEKDGNRALWSFDNKKTFERLVKMNEPLSNGFVDVDSNDNIFFRTDAPHYLLRSETFGKTWESVGLKGMDTFWGIAESEKGVLYGSAWSESDNSPYLYKSVDKGKTWKLWKDFWQVFPDKAVLYDANDQRRKLRHLHDVVVYQDIFVLGTGDVGGQTLVSQDDGQTWKEILDNGFTSHILLSQEGKVLLGGDSPRGHGINLYDFETGKTQKVWSPLDCGWSGYLFDMLEKQNVYYATAQIENYSGQKYGVLISTDVFHWQPLFEVTADPKLFHIPIFISSGPSDFVYLSLDGELFSFK